MKANFFKWALLSALCAVGFFGFLLLAGDDDPYNPMPLGKWFLLKLFGAALIAASVYVGRILNRHNLMPDFDEMVKEEQE